MTADMAESPMPPYEASIYHTARLQLALEREGLDAVVATTLENIAYFTGILPVTRILRPYDGRCFAIICRREPNVLHMVHFVGEADQLQEIRAPLGHVRLYGVFYRERPESADLNGDEAQLAAWSDIAGTFSDPWQALQDLVKALNLGSARLGVDEDGLGGAGAVALRASLGNAEFIPWSEGIRWVRRVKTTHEVKLLGLAAHANVRAVHAALSQLRPDMSEVEIARLFEKSLVEQNSKPELTMLKIGRHAVGGQRRPREDIRYAPGDLVWFDSDNRYLTHWADIARVYVPDGFAGRSEILDRMAALRAGMSAAKRTIEPGMTGAQVFSLVVEAVRQAGFASYRRHHVGHGIGVEPYERPLLAPHEDAIVEDGAVLSIETPFYEFGTGALHLEDPLWVRAKGNTFLTDADYG
jgi:Xaa-Pro dipeptidase